MATLDGIIKIDNNTMATQIIHDAMERGDQYISVHIGKDNTDISIWTDSGKQDMGGWISTKEKLPSECKRYLCITKWNGYQVCLWYGGEWCWMDHTYVVDEIKWWRELPDPPEEVDSDA